MEYNIYQEQIDGSSCFRKTLYGESKEDVLLKFFQENNIIEEERRMYYAVDKERDEEEKSILKASGCSSWNQYIEDMYPSRPIEL